MPDLPYSTKPSFKDMMNDVVAADTCCECGTCVLVCPHNVIEYIEGRPKQTAKPAAEFDYCGISEGIGCDVCSQVCPRIGAREFHLHDDVFANEDGRMLSGGCGPYQEIFVARTKDPRIREVCQDGGVVTTLLVHGLETGAFDGAVVSAPDPDRPCAPQPVCATTVEEVIEAAGSWYTYCPNDLALAQAADKGCERVAFVGVPCQITPLRKAEQRDPEFIRTEKKRDKMIDRQTASLKGPVERVAMTVGLLCSEVFNFDGLMEGMIQREMGIPLASVEKFNVKGEVLVYPSGKEVVKIPLSEAQQHARPACEHCGDFSAELADVSCGGVGAMGWTITIARSDRGRAMLADMIERDLLEVRPIEEFEGSLKVLLRLARRQHQRVPETSHELAAVRPSYNMPPKEAGSQ